ncbi:MAG: 16S rRNA (guanine(966)-N(2))-methyltransferase RsmD [Actinobacteria bacterium]|jgi:16S rRNA (guanine966-N2)-methyltransferase|nr:16S rRNA (guanine(966)-N(2))-methyltransferase RsmD [Actinomycetota bacterium]
MRIIAGVAKGRSLSSVAGATRPTSDRAREAIFSTLTSEFGDFLGLQILDLFAGSGAMGLEALSRGASLVHCVEKDDAAAKTISTNASLVQKAQPVGVFHLFHMSAQKFVEGTPQNQYHFIYIDPPYDFSDSEISTILEKLHENSFFKDGAVIAIERASKTAQPVWPQGYEPSRTKVYGQASIYYANYAKNG